MNYYGVHPASTIIECKFHFKCMNIVIFAMSLENPSFSFEVAVMIYHWKSTMDFVEVDVHGDVPGAQVKGMKV